MESEAPDACAPAPAPGPAPAIDDDRVHEPTDPELIQLNGLLQSALTELGHKVIEFGWDKDPNHGKSPLCLPYDEYMKPITTSEEEAGYDPEVDDPDWDNYPFKWGGVVPEAWALEFIAKYLKEHNPAGWGAGAHPRRRPPRRPRRRRPRRRRRCRATCTLESSQTTSTRRSACSARCRRRSRATRRARFRTSDLVAAGARAAAAAACHRSRGGGGPPGRGVAWMLPPRRLLCTS